MVFKSFKKKGRNSIPMLVRKLFMSQVFDKVGGASPVSVFKIIPCFLYKSLLPDPLGNENNFLLLWGIPNPKRIKKSHSSLLKKKIGGSNFEHEKNKWVDLNKAGYVRQFKISNDFIFRNILTFSSSLEDKTTDSGVSDQLGYNNKYGKSNSIFEKQMGSMSHLSNSTFALKREFNELHSFGGLNRFMGELASPVNLGINFENEFERTQKVSLIGKKIGRGFLGNRKKHGFTRGPMTHGSKNHRLPGSIGASANPSRVLPGKKMAGRSKLCYRRLEKVEIYYLNNSYGFIVLKGPVPGKKGNIIELFKNYY